MVEVPERSVEGAVPKEGLSIAQVVSVAVHGDGCCAAEVVGVEFAEAKGTAQFAECCLQGVLIARLWVCGGFAVARPQLPDERLRVAHVAIVEQCFDGACGWQGEALAHLGCERECPALLVVVSGGEAGCCTGANGEVGTEQEPQAQVRRGCGKEGRALVVVDQHIARAQSGIFPHVGVQFWGAVEFPKVAEDAAEGGGVV